MVASTPTQPLIGGIQRVIGSKLREDRHIGEMMPEIGTATKLPLNFFHYAAGAGGCSWPGAAFVARTDLIAIGGKPDAAGSRANDAIDPERHFATVN